MATAEAINNLGACTHNPRGNLWFKDESTYGHKLLMKMGWKHGKGLGKNENGIKENLSVKFRGTNSGLGYKDDPYANVMKTEYEAILKNLNDKYSQNESQSVQKGSYRQDKSFSQKSKVVRSKVRYPKLFFGKDVNKYSEKDMKSIFICSLPSNDKEEFVDKESNVSSKNTTSETEVSGITGTHCSTLSISEYFATKMKDRKNNILKEKDGRKVDNQELALVPEVSQAPSLNQKLPKKKERNSNINFILESKDDSDLQEAALDFEMTESAVLPDKKSSSKKRKKCSATDASVPEANLWDNEKDHELKSPKKKKPKISQLVSENNRNLYSLNSIQKKTKVCENGLSSSVNSTVHNTLDSRISCQIELSSTSGLELNKRSKKCSKSKKSMIVPEFSVENSLPEKNETVDNSSELNSHPSVEIIENGESNVDAVCSKKKRKKMKLKKLKSCLKSKRGSYSLKNVSFNESVSFKVIDTDYESFDCLSGACSVKKRESASEIIDTVVENSIANINPSASQELCSNIESTELEEKVLDEQSKKKVLDEQSESNSEKQLHNNLSAEIQETLSKESENGCSLLGLPSSNSPNYNSWIEDQRQALKMKMYKRMLKSLKKHAVLGSTNLTSIKGYGNWGF